MADHDGPLDAELREQRVHLHRDDVEVGGRRFALAVAGEVDGDRVHVVAEAVDDRAPAAAVEREAVQQDDGVPLPWDSYARVDMGVSFWERFCNVVP